MPGVLNQAGRVVPGEAFIHRGFIAGIHGDSPARAKILYFVGCFTAYLVCVYCRLCGIQKQRTRRYTGYVAPVTAVRGVVPGKAYQMGRQHDAGVRSIVFSAVCSVRCGCMSRGCHL